MAFGFSLQSGDPLLGQGGDSALLLEQVADGPADRERDVRAAIRDLLEATGAFDNVYLTGTPDAHGQNAADTRSCAIDPIKEAHQVDDDLGGAVVVHGQVLLTFIARDYDDVAADSACERLFLIAANALNGQSLDGLTFPVFTRLARGRWSNKRTPPERRKAGTLEYAYLVETWTSFGVAE